jgi:hypothetical protein
MINIIFDKYRLIIEDSTNTGYARILYLKNLILVANDNITELTLLDKDRKFLYTFNSANSTYTNFTYLGDLVGYALSIGSETNFNQSIRQATLTLVDYHYVYVKDSDNESYIYYNNTFNVVPNIESAEGKPQIFYTNKFTVDETLNGSYFCGINNGTPNLSVSSSDIEIPIGDGVINYIQLYLPSAGGITEDFIVDVLVNGATIGNLEIVAGTFGLFTSTIVDESILSTDLISLLVTVPSGTGNVSVSAISLIFTPT